MTPRRQETPPDEPGLWLLRRDGFAHPWPFIYIEAMRGTPPTFLVAGAQPTPIKRTGDVWEGPFPLPSVPDEPGTELTPTERT